MLAYVYLTHSFAHLSRWSVLIGLADVWANDYRERMAFVKQQPADIVVRFSPSTLPVEDEQGKEVWVVRWRKRPSCARRTAV